MYRRNVQSFEKSDGSSWSNLSFSPPPLISLSFFPLSPKRNEKREKKREKKKKGKKSKTSFAKPLLLLTTPNLYCCKRLIIRVCSLF